jgi:DNA-binding transcriptional LysR family regulator
VLQPSRMILMANPAYARRLGPLKSPEDIAEAATLSMMASGDRHVWRFRHVDGATAEVAHWPRLKTDDLYTIRRATLAGVGIAFLPEMLVADDVARGYLVHLLPAWEAQTGLLHAVFPSRRGMVPAVREFLDALVAHFGPTP